MNNERHQVAIALFVAFLKDDQVLLSRRFETGFMDGSYDLPAGHLEPGETIKNAAVREVREELGLDIDGEKLSLFHINQSNYYGTPYINFMFSIKDWRGVPKICEPDKSDDLRFFDLDKLPSDLTPHVKEALVHISDQEISYSFIDRQKQ